VPNTRARPALFCVLDFQERCNEKEAKDEETNFVKRVVEIVKAAERRGQSVA
jgi:hypothetical protein